MLALLLAVVAFAALLLVVLPLLRPARDEGSRAQFDRAVYRDQLRELDRDVARGLVSGAEAGSARLEIQRRLLAADGLGDSRLRQGRSPLMALLIGMVAACGAVGVYTFIGAPGVPDEPYASRENGSMQAATDEQASMRQAAAGLVAQLKVQPDNPKAWALLARTRMTMGDWGGAVDAYHQAQDHGARDPDTLAGHGEALVMQAKGIVTPAARNAFAAALAGDPKNPSARYYEALALAEGGDPRKAIEQWQALLSDMPENAEARAEVGRRIAEAAKDAGMPVPALARGQAAAPGPDAGAMAAASAMPEADRKAMIEGMVAKLAARLEAQPNDADGWERLGRAYRVMGDRSKAADAYAHAASLKPGDAAVRMQAVAALMGGLKPADAIPSQALMLLKEAEAVVPDAPEVLWYAGMVAVHDRKPDVARGYWQRLEANLPPDSEEARMVKAALDVLK
jgi:cytochrome c-type biogenesis protein CcmH